MSTILSDELGQRLHDRATRGESLLCEERAQLEAWYAHHDARESERLAAAPIPCDATQTQQLIQQATAQLVLHAQRIQAVTAENAQLRQEIAELQQQLVAKQTKQPT